jgi:hypothetical protein
VNSAADVWLLVSYNTQRPSHVQAFNTRELDTLTNYGRGW